MNARTQITMDPEMQRRAQAKAAELGISFAEYVRRLVAQDVGEPRRKVDVSVIFNLVDEGPTTDIARDKDKMIGEALLAELFAGNWTGAKASSSETAYRAEAEPVTVFVDTSIWYASVVVRDRQNAHARAILNNATDLVTTDHVLVETCLLLTSRFRLEIAERFWEGIRCGVAALEIISMADLETAWAIGRIYSDQQFSIVDRTSFAIMERLGITQVASFDHHFAIYRYGRNRDRAFEVLR